MSKHTKGPWKLNERTGDTIIDSERNIVAYINTYDGTNLDEEKANANLIAKAPELLELTEVWESRGGLVPGMQCRWCPRIKTDYPKKEHYKRCIAHKDNWLGKLLAKEPKE